MRGPIRAKMAQNRPSVPRHGTDGPICPISRRERGERWRTQPSRQLQQPKKTGKLGGQEERLLQVVVASDRAVKGQENAQEQSSEQ